MTRDGNMRSKIMPNSLVQTHTPPSCDLSFMDTNFYSHFLPSRQLKMLELAYKNSFLVMPKHSIVHQKHKQLHLSIQVHMVSLLPSSKMAV